MGSSVLTQLSASATFKTEHKQGFGGVDLKMPFINRETIGKFPRVV